MTAIEMRLEFLARYDAATSLAAPGWEDPEISNFLNIAQLRLVNEKYLTKDYNPISNLIITTSGSAVTHSSISNTYYLDLATAQGDYLYYLRSRSKLTRTNPVIIDDWVPNDELSNQVHADMFYTTAFNKPWFKYPKVYTEVSETINSLVVLVDYYTSGVSEIEITAITKPTDIDVDTNTSTNLDLVLHTTIVEYAVEEALKSIKIAKLSNQ